MSQRDADEMKHRRANRDAPGEGQQEPEQDERRIAQRRPGATSVGSTAQHGPPASSGLPSGLAENDAEETPDADDDAR